SSLCSFFYFLLSLPPPPSTLFPYTTLFRSSRDGPSSTLSTARQSLQSSPNPVDSTSAGHRRTGSLVALARSARIASAPAQEPARSEEHTSELQSRENLVCRLLLEKKKNKTT